MSKLRRFLVVLLRWNRAIKDRVENIEFLTKKIETKAFVLFERAWSQEFKNVLFFSSIAPYAEKYKSEGAENGQ